MNILQIRSGFEDNGPGTQALTIARELRRRGHDVTFAAGGGHFLPSIREAGFHVEMVPDLARTRRDVGGVLRAGAAVRRLVRSRGVAAIHAHNAATALTGWAATRGLGGTPSVVHSVRGVELRPRYRWRNWIYRAYPVHMLAVCEFTRRELVALGASRDRITVTYNGVDTDRFDRDGVSGSAIRREFGLQDDDVVIGHIGSMRTDAKGQHVLLAAFAAFAAAQPRARLLFVGDGAQRPALERQAAALDLGGRVSFAGRRFDAEGFHAAFDIYAQPSIWGEMFPNAILEAMAMATPWVGSRLSGLGEMTAEGRAGVLVEPGDVAGLAAALQRLVADPAERAERGAAGYREVMDRFSIRAVVDRIERAYGLHPGAGPGG